MCGRPEGVTAAQGLSSSDQEFGTGDYVRGDGVAYQNGSPVFMISFNDVRGGPGGQEAGGQPSAVGTARRTESFS